MKNSFGQYVDHDSETIVAQCTPSGPGAIAIVRVSGPQACTLVQSFARCAKGANLETVPSHSITYGAVLDTFGKVLDRVLFLVMRAPQTFTGQDVVEICCHNNSFIIEAIIESALKAGARLATPGEFSKRAVLNGKLSLIDAEAINELARAATAQARSQALKQLDGSLTHHINQIEQALIKALAYTESSFEFLDEELTFDDVIIASLVEARGALESLTKQNLQQKAVREGVRIALLGAVNAGKSSCFNALLETKRAIVTPIAGTTRDTLEAVIYTPDCTITLVDTAGLRQTDDVIEQEGIERSYQEAIKADIICLLVDSSRIATAEEIVVYQTVLKQHAEKTIVVGTKSDMSLNKLFEWLHPDISVHYVSINNRSQINLLKSMLLEKASRLCHSETAGFLLNKRQAHLIVQAQSAVYEAHKLCAYPFAYELIAIHLKDALALLTELSGKTISEKGMDAVFHEFCVGK